MLPRERLDATRTRARQQARVATTKLIGRVERPHCLASRADRRMLAAAMRLALGVVKRSSSVFPCSESTLTGYWKPMRHVLVDREVYLEESQSTGSGFACVRSRG